MNTTPPTRTMNPDEIRFRSALTATLTEAFPGVRYNVGAYSLSANGLEYKNSLVEIYVETPETLSIYLTVDNDRSLATELAVAEQDDEDDAVSDDAIKEQLRFLAMELASDLIRGLAYSINHMEVDGASTTVIITADEEDPTMAEFKQLLSRMSYRRSGLLTVSPGNQ